MEEITMIERVARAISEVEMENGEPLVDWVSIATCERVARAAIVAMREPDEEMKAAGYDGARRGNVCVGIYKNMIDAALKP